MKSTKEIKVSKQINEQVIGQDHALQIIKKSAKQRRNVLLVGEPGTGKSMIGQALAELLQTEQLVDILAFPNQADDNVPLVRTVSKGEGKKLITKQKLALSSSLKTQNFVMFIIIIAISLLPYYFWRSGTISDVVYAASMISSMVFIVGFILFINLGKRMKMGDSQQGLPKLLVDNSERKTAPFDATGSHAGALLGDVLHDPLQSFVAAKLQQENKQADMKKTVEKILKKHKKNLIKTESHTAVYTNKNELKVLAEQKGKIKNAEVLSVNKYFKKGHLIKLTTEFGKELIVTPEHKVAIKTKTNEIKYIRADKLKSWHRVITLA